MENPKLYTFSKIEITKKSYIMDFQLVLTSSGTLGAILYCRFKDTRDSL